MARTGRPPLPHDRYLAARTWRLLPAHLAMVQAQAARRSLTESAALRELLELADAVRDTPQGRRALKRLAEQRRAL